MNVTDPQAAAEISSGQDVTQQLVKASRTRRLYLRNNPIYDRTVQDLVEKLDRHLREYREIRLRVDHHDFLLRGRSVYSNPHLTESLASTLYLSGVRELCIHEGVTREELEDLLSLFERRPDPMDDDDFATLLWEHTLPHISYVLEEESAGMAEGAAQAIPPKEGLNKEQVEGLGAEVARSEPEVHSDTVSNIFTLSEEDVRSLKGEIEAENLRDPFIELFSILISILRIEDDPGSFGEVLTIFQNVLFMLVENGDLERATRLLSTLNDLVQSGGDLPASLREKLEEFLDKILTPDTVEALNQQLNSERPIKPETIQQLFSLLRPSAIPELLGLLGILKKMRVRKMLCEVLAGLGTKNPDAVARGLSHPQWFVVRNVVYIIGRMGRPAIERLEKVVSHPEPRVRKEAIRALEITGDEKVIPLMSRFLVDPDPNVRLLALRTFGNLGHREVFPVVMKMVSSRDFRLKEAQEKHAVLEVMARTGGREAIPILERLLGAGRWSLWSRESAREVAVGAARALAVLFDVPDAVEALRKAARKGDKSLRQVCASLLAGSGSGPARRV